MRSRQEVISPELLLQAYSHGFFPMADSDTGEVEWYSANPRAVLPLYPFHVPRRLQRWLKTTPFQYTTDRAFESVMRACADRESTWINDTLLHSYTLLHQLNYAHSVEVWQDGELVGGLYGVHLGGAFFGESTFNRAPNAAKAALVHLAEHLQEREFKLLEIQMITRLTEQFGARHVWRDEYRKLLDEALAVQCEW